MGFGSSPREPKRVQKGYQARGKRVKGGSGRDRPFQEPTRNPQNPLHSTTACILEDPRGSASCSHAWKLWWSLWKARRIPGRRMLEDGEGWGVRVRQLMAPVSRFRFAGYCNDPLSPLSSLLLPPLSPPARPGKKGLRRARLRVAKNYVADTTVQLHDHTEDQE